MGGQFPDYPQQSRYGGVPHAAYGVLPAYGVPPAAQYLPHQGMPPAPDGGYDADALALAQGMNNMVLGPGQQQMVQLQGQYYAPHRQPRMPAGYGPPAGYTYPPQGPGLRGPPMGQQQYQQQQYQQHPGQPGMGHPPMGMNGHPMDMRGPMQNGRGPAGPRMGPGPRGMGPQQQQQMQRGGRKKVQRGLEDNVKRTVYISYIDQQVRLCWGQALCCTHQALCWRSQQHMQGC